MLPKITAMKPEQFVDTAKNDQVSRDYFLKEEWLRGGKLILKKLAKILELPKDSYEIRINKGGGAVSGDVILHGENVYINLSQFCNKTLFMWRYCKGMKDYSGGVNRWESWNSLLNLEKFAEKIKQPQVFEIV